MSRIKISEEEMIRMYNDRVPMEEIAIIAKVSRQAIWSKLKRLGEDGKFEYKPRVSKEIRSCKFCGLKFEIPSKIKTEHCSIECFHKARVICGDKKGSMGGNVRTDRRKARAVIEESGIILTEGYIVHHINSDTSDNRLVNLQVFNSHSEHMKHHHSLEKRVSFKEIDGVLIKKRKDYRKFWSEEKKTFYSKVIPWIHKLSGDELVRAKEQLLEEFSGSREMKHIIQSYTPRRK